MEEKRSVYRVFVGKHEGERLTGRPRHRWKDKCKWILIRNRMGESGLE
jgi:hypothetical protein